MLRSANELLGYVLLAEDGEIGQCKDFLFDDEKWTIRYMVADTGKWLPKRRVLISPISLGDPDWVSRRLPVRLTRDQIEKAPSIDEDAPVSKQYEIEYFRYFGYPYYWGGGGVWGEGPYPSLLYVGEGAQAPPPGEGGDGDRHLRSTKTVTGYAIDAADGDIGHVEEFVVDDATWTVRYVVVDTRNWLPGRKVLVSPDWITNVDWTEAKVSVDLNRDAVKSSPEYNPATPVNREYEARLYDFYGRPTYW